MTTNTSPGRTSNETSRTATLEPVDSRSSSRLSSASGVPMIRCSPGPKIFHRPRTEIVALSIGAAASARRACANGPGAGNVDVMPWASR